MVKPIIKERVRLWFGVLCRRLSQRKSFDTVAAEKQLVNDLRPDALNLIHLVSIGLGSTIGAGIFVSSGIAAAQYAGPSVIISFILSGVVALLSALSFAELSSMMCTPGSAYTYAYVALGESLAFFVGWSYTLLNQLAAATIVVDWSQYVVNFINLISNYNATRWIVQAPVTYSEATQTFSITGQVINLPAIALSIAITIVLILGIRETSTVNLVLVTFKVIVLLIFIFAGCVYVRRANYSPFFPTNKGSFNEYGFTGMLQASSYVFFAYIGFEGVPTMGKEAKNSSKNIYRAIIITLVITICLYVGISTVMVGLVPYSYLDQDSPLTAAVKATSYGMWLLIILNLGGIAGLTSVALITLLVQTRIFYAMAFDGLLPSAFHAVQQSRKTPWLATLISGSMCGILAGVCPVDVIGDAASIAALIIYILVHVCVIVMRYTHRDISRQFSVPGGPWLVPTVGILLCVLLLINTTKSTAIRYFVWMGVGAIFYFSYSFWFSKITRKNRRVAPARDIEPAPMMNTIDSNLPLGTLPSLPSESQLVHFF